MGERVRVSARIEGVVQGVGFRPFVYRQALAAGVGGYVRNAGGYVDAAFEGDRDAIEDLIEAVRTDNPPLSVVETVELTEAEPVGTDEFEIRDSHSAEGDREDDGGAVPVPPDTGICDRCLSDVRDPDSRYHGYWATSCVDCGPRYTIVSGVPYDRKRTSMVEFPQCADCRDRYADPADRRYHAQTIACPACGPELRYEVDGEAVDGGPEPLDRAGKAIADGEVIAVKGTGGTHLVCDATRPATVRQLRDRTNRPAKPFALMAPSMSTVESFAAVDGTAREAMTDIRRPISVVEHGADEEWLSAVAPGLHTVGVMLPYAGLHHLLFDRVEGPLVMTSANRPGEPMVTSGPELWERLGDVVDGALLHDRDIVARCDDSVVRAVGERSRFLRRSRGWTPRALPNPAGGEDTPGVLALGPGRDVTVAIAEGNRIVLSQHIGDVDGPEGLGFLRETADRLTALCGVDPDLVACDRHPDLTTTAEADRRTEETVRVGHHHAHAAALCAEHGCERAIVVTADGTGDGPDGTVWGGEVLDARYHGAQRVGGLAPFRLPGGEAAVRYPARVLASLLDDSALVDERLVETGAVESPSEASVVREQAQREVNAPVTTSAGRFLDAVSVLVGACDRRRYQGEPALRLEALAAGGSAREIPLSYEEREGRRVLDVAGLVSRLAALTDQFPPAAVAATAQEALARGLGQLAVESARQREVERVGFTGGVAYNEAIFTRIKQTVTDAGLEFLGPEEVPPGDGGIAYGQAVVASARRSRDHEVET